MNEPKTFTRKRDPAKAVMMRARAYDRLRSYVEKQRIRPLILDVISEAVDQWLDKQEAKK